MQRTNSLALIILAYILAACTAPSTPVQPTAVRTQAVEPAISAEAEHLPQSELEVPRIAVEEARLAVESGEAILVDVRAPGAFEASHIAGAISVPLGQIERDLSEIPLEKEQWIITYCT